MADGVAGRLRILGAFALTIIGSRVFCHFFVFCVVDVELVPYAECEYCLVPLGSCRAGEL